ncbi:hypothetical protein C8J56DRAFT_36084 [Mycena floridula]|nr:hypothetical protein C8J56DRAFT_36084 [Mycena floridula]
MLFSKSSFFALGMASATLVAAFPTMASNTGYQLERRSNDHLERRLEFWLDKRDQIDNIIVELSARAKKEEEAKGPETEQPKGPAAGKSLDKRDGILVTRGKDEHALAKEAAGKWRETTWKTQRAAKAQVQQAAWFNDAKMTEEEYKAYAEKCARREGFAQPINLGTGPSIQRKKDVVQGAAGGRSSPAGKSFPRWTKSRAVGS